MGRKDGRLMKELNAGTKFYTFLMPKRVTSSCWTQLSVNAENMIRYISDKAEIGEKYTVFQTIAAALIRTGSQFPELNRFIYRHKFYARTEYTISFAVNTGSETVFRKVRFSPDATIRQVHEKLEEVVSSARTQPHDSLDNSMDFMMKLPDFLSAFILRMYPVLVDKGIFPRKFADEDVLYTSAMVSNLGTFGLKAPYHHLYEWGNASVFVTIGEIGKIPAVMPDDSIKAVNSISIGFTVDERITDGKTISAALRLFQNLAENPELLEIPPEKVVRE